MALTGVNLGGWLVCEKWMTPELFKGTDATNEYELSLDTAGRRRIAKHRKEFITKSDIDWLANHGVELLRVPIGYWAVTDTDDYVDAKQNLDWLIEMTRQTGMKLLLDLHAAPGAQNTRDHSGSGTIPHQRWLRNKQAQRETIDILLQLAQRYHHEHHIWGIELLNEPDPGVFGLKLIWFYRRAYRALTTVARSGTRIIFSDGYRPWLFSGTFALMTRREFPVVMDLHIYQCFGIFKRFRSMQTQLRIARLWRSYLRIFSWVQPVMVGEWSGMVTCPSTGDQTTEFIATQYASFSGSEAQCYWSYKASGGGRWSYRAMVDEGKYLDAIKI